MTLDPARDPFAWSPLSFLRALREPLLAHLQLELEAAVADPAVSVLAGADGSRVLLRPMPWDSDWFGCSMAKVEHALPGADGAGGLARLLLEARDRVAARAGEGPWQLVLDAPADALEVVQAAGLAGMRLVETRATYVLEDLRGFQTDDRSITRMATPEDAAALRAVSAGARNPWDRYHADPFFPAEVADGYLGEYAARSVLGLADAVIMPDEPPGSAPGGFMTLQVSAPPACPVGLDHVCGISLGVGRIRLVAVGPERQGWHRRLLAASTRWFRDQGLDIVTMTTQLSNRPVTRNSEALGYRLGRATHLLVASAGRAETGRRPA